VSGFIGFYSGSLHFLWIWMGWIMGFMSFARILGPSFSGIRYRFDWSSRVTGFDSLVFLFEKVWSQPLVHPLFTWSPNLLGLGLGSGRDPRLHESGLTRTGFWLTLLIAILLKFFIHSTARIWDTIHVRCCIGYAIWHIQLFY
jgi:hypothetical protein